MTNEKGKTVYLDRRVSTLEHQVTVLQAALGSQARLIDGLQRKIEQGQVEPISAVKAMQSEVPKRAIF